MIVYSSDKKEFLNDMDSGDIEEKILRLIQTRTGKSIGKNEILSWKNSLPYMDRALRGVQDIPDNAGISIEYHIPNSAKRIDFVISGLNEKKEESVVIIELKQWSVIEPTDIPSTVRVQFAHGKAESVHPCYQAWSYSRIIQDYNETVQDDKIQLLPCAYLHNYKSDGIIDNEFYQEDIDRAPLFLKEDIAKLREFIKKYIKHGDTKNILYRIDNGKIRPSKQLADHLVGLLKGNPEFVLIDEQKIAYEICLKSLSKNKQNNVIVIEGGPGTGKTVLAINLLVEATKRGKLVQYVSKNSAPREVYQSKLSGTMKKTQIANLFVGSGSFTTSKPNEFDMLIVDEAHRLNEKSGLFRNQGENQIKELISAAKTTVFLIDEDQRVTIHDIGRKSEILNFAKSQGANVIELKLESQFRCNGSDGYIAWLDNSLDIRPTANLTINDLNYDFKVFDNPSKMFDAIKSKNTNNKARLVAGYCWDWISKKSPKSFDITFPDFKFAMKWNLAEAVMLWVIKKDSINEIGCIHTCQGLELDYVGVIIGPDLIVRNKKIITSYQARAKTDQSLKGIKKMASTNMLGAKKLADEIIKNTYRTLMTRGMKGCYIFSEDAETRQYFQDLLKINVEEKYQIKKISSLKVADKTKKYGKKK
ncbi:AAA family ATPase [Bdellovibrio sp. qaytius]|nr:AAA family ATPase [Bdellovibrio sp. qaytius]